MNQSMNPFLRPLAPAAPRGITHWASKPALTRQASQLRPTQVAAVLQPPPHGSTSVNDVETALRVACNALGRPYSAQEQALAERLKANWYTQPADVAMMDTVCAVLPLRTPSCTPPLFFTHAGRGSSPAGTLPPAQANPAAARPCNCRRSKPYYSKHHLPAAATDHGAGTCHQHGCLPSWHGCQGDWRDA